LGAALAAEGEGLSQLEEFDLLLDECEHGWDGILPLLDGSAPCATTLSVLKVQAPLRKATTQAFLHALGRGAFPRLTTLSFSSQGHALPPQGAETVRPRLPG
jgi:hypothetical protein